MNVSAHMYCLMLKCTHALLTSLYRLSINGEKQFNCKREISKFCSSNFVFPWYYLINVYETCNKHIIHTKCKYIENI